MWIFLRAFSTCWKRSTITLLNTNIKICLYYTTISHVLLILSVLKPTAKLCLWWIKCCPTLGSLFFFSEAIWAFQQCSFSIRQDWKLSVYHSCNNFFFFVKLTILSWVKKQINCQSHSWEVRLPCCVSKVNPFTIPRTKNMNLWKT